MAYVNIRGSGKYRYVYVAESYRENGKNKMRTLAKLGKLSDIIENNPNALKEIEEKIKDENFVASLKERLIEQDSQDEEVKSYLELSNYDGYEWPLHAYKNFGFLFLDKIFNSFNLKPVIKNHFSNTKIKYESIYSTLLLLVCLRILFPCSKSQSVKLQRWLMHSYGVTQNIMDKSLDHFEGLKGKIFAQLNDYVSNRFGSRDGTVFYDVTNYYFFTEHNDKDDEEELRQNGCSKENRCKPIIQMGLFMDSNGIPISYNLFRGNTSDVSTYKFSVDELKQFVDVKKIVCVADKAMNSDKNISYNVRNGMGYIYSSKVKAYSLKKIDREYVTDVSDLKYSRDKTFGYKSKIRERKLSTGEIIKEKMIIVWKDAYAIREQKKRNELRKELEILNGTSKKSVMKRAYSKYSKNEGMLLEKFKVDFEKLENEAIFDGIQLLLTSEIDKDDLFIIKKYGELSDIEACFKTIKTCLKTRPVYVWERSHIEAHFLTCFIALVIIKVMYHSMNESMSVEKILNGIRFAGLINRKNGKCYLSINEDTRDLFLHYHLPKLNEVMFKEDVYKVFDNFCI